MDPTIYEINGVKHCSVALFFEDATSFLVADNIFLHGCMIYVMGTGGRAYA